MSLSTTSTPPFTQIIHRLNETLQLIASAPTPQQDTHFQLLLQLIPSRDQYQSIASYYATKSDLTFTDQHLKLLLHLDSWNDPNILLNVLCGQCRYLDTKLQRDYILKFLRVEQQEWAQDLLQVWLNDLKETKREEESLHLHQQNEQHDEQLVRERNHAKPINIFKLFQAILEREDTTHNSEEFPTEWKKSLLVIMIQKWSQWNKEETQFLMRHIFPLCLALDIHKELLLTWLWKMAKECSGIKTLQREEETSSSPHWEELSTQAFPTNPNRTYQILSQYFEYFFTNLAPSQVDLRFKEDFWTLLFDGLKKPQSFVLKRCEYLLRRIIDVSKSDKQHTQYTKYFQFDSSAPQQSEKIWVTWFMLWDCVMQHSTHLLQPVWGQIFKFFPRKDGSSEFAYYLHPEWIQILFHHAFHHDNFAVQKMVLASFYSFDFDTYEMMFSLDYILNVVFLCSDQIKLYVDKHSIGHRMIRFMLKYVQQIADATRVQELILKMIDIMGDSSIPITYTGLSYFFKFILLVDKQLIGDVLTTKVVKSFEKMLHDNVTLNGGWIKIRQCTLIGELLMHLGEFSNENASSISHLLQHFKDAVFQVSSFTERLSNHFSNDILQNHITTLLKEYFNETNSLLHTTQDVKQFEKNAHRIVTMCRFINDDARLLETLSPFLSDIIEGLYSRSYLSIVQKFKALTLLSPLLRLQQRVGPLLEQHIVAPNFNELISFATAHLTYSATSPNDMYSCSLANDVSAVFCDRPLLQLIDHLLTGKSSLFSQNAQLLTLVKQVLVDRPVAFVEEMHQTTLGGKTVLRNADPTFAVICNLLMLRALLSINVFAHCIDCCSVQNGKVQFAFAPSRDETASHEEVLSYSARAFNATRLVPLIMASKSGISSSVAPQSLADAAQNWTISDLGTKICKKKWSTLYVFLHYSHALGIPLIRDANSREETLQDLLEEAQDALDVIDSRATTIPLSCIALLLSLLEQESSYNVDSFKSIVRNCERAASGTSHGTEIECYFALVKVLLGHKFALRADYAKAVLLPSLRSLLEKGTTLSRVLIAVAYEIGQVIANPDISPHDKTQLCPFIYDLLACHTEDVAALGHNHTDLVHVDFVSSPVDIEVRKLYPASMNFTQQVCAIIFLSIQNIPPQSDEFVSCMLKTFFTRRKGEVVNKLAPNSPEFNFMIRSWKMLIILTGHMSTKVCRENFNLIWDTISWTRPHSVKRLIECFVIVLCTKFPFVADQLETDCKEVNAAAGVSISRMILLGSLMTFGPESLFIERATHVWPIAITFCNSTHHNIRTIAQSLVCSMYHRREKLLREGKATEEQMALSSDVELIYKFIIESESCMKWIVKYQTVFMFDPFLSTDPEKLFLHPLDTHDKILVVDHVPESVFEDVKEHAFGLIASTCNIMERDTSRIRYYVENWVRPDRKLSYLESPLQEFMPSDSTYRDFIDAFMKKYASLASDENTRKLSQPTEEESNDEELNFQKKLVPWQEMDITNELNPRLGRDTGRHSMIVCATFVDRVPNLAGLSRTSEIFNMEKLLFANKRVTRLDNFKNISVTSENWMPIDQVPEEELMQYLEDKKQEGYSIVGLEQTSDSVGIDEFVFPKKCVLLLGKEREGIPSDYLQLLDACVEIQQFGLVRSLNVHVSASIMMYEYTKQHYMQGSIGNKAE